MLRWIMLIAAVVGVLTALLFALGGGGESPGPRSLERTGGPRPARDDPSPTTSPTLAAPDPGLRTLAGRGALAAIHLLVVGANGKPVPGARIVFLDRDGAPDWKDEWDTQRLREVFILRHGRQMSCDRDGLLILPGTSSGAVTAAVAGLTGYLEWDRPVTEDPLRLVLREPRNLEVLVIDHRGRPQAGVGVAIVRESHSRSQPLLVRQTHNGGKATFGMVGRVLGGRAPEGTSHYVTFAFPCLDPPRLEIDPEDLPTEPLRLELPPVGALEVEVVGERGLPVTEIANVSLGRMIPAQGGKQVFLADQTVRLMGGKAAFGHLGVGTRVAIKLSGSRERADLIEMHDGPTHSSDMQRVKVRWTDRYPVLLGVAVSDTGRVLAGFRGRYTVWSEERGSGGPALMTGPDGGFRLVVATHLAAEPGRYAELELYARNGEGPFALELDLSRELSPGEEDLGHLTFLPKPKLVTGVVRDVSGRPMIGVHVRVIVEDGADRRSSNLSATTLQGGEFTIFGSAPDGFRLVAVRRGYTTPPRENLNAGTTGLELVMLPDLPKAGDQRRR